MKKPPPIRAWALMVKKYRKWVPVNDVPNIPHLYPSRRLARRTRLGSRGRPWEQIYQVEIRVVTKRKRRKS